MIRSSDKVFVIATNFFSLTKSCLINVIILSQALENQKFFLSWYVSSMLLIKRFHISNGCHFLLNFSSLSFHEARQ